MSQPYHALVRSEMKECGGKHEERMRGSRREISFGRLLPWVVRASGFDRTGSMNYLIMWPMAGLTLRVLPFFFFFRQGQGSVVDSNQSEYSSDRGAIIRLSKLYLLPKS